MSIPWDGHQLFQCRHQHPRSSGSSWNLHTTFEVYCQISQCTTCVLCSQHYWCPGKDDKEKKCKSQGKTADGPVLDLVKTQIKPWISQLFMSSVRFLQQCCLEHCDKKNFKYLKKSFFFGCKWLKKPIVWCDDNLNKLSWNLFCYEMHGYTGSVQYWKACELDSLFWKILGFT